MEAGKRAIPETIEVKYEHHKTGVFCALSEDLPGLMVFGTSIEGVQDDVLAVAAALVRERFGEEVSYVWDMPSEEGFVPLKSGRLHLEPMHA